MRNRFYEMWKSRLPSTGKLHAESHGPNAPSWSKGWKCLGERIAATVTVEATKSGAFVGLLIDAPFDKQFCYEATQENTQNALARMLRAEGIRIPGSKQANYFLRRYYRIPCVCVFFWGGGIYCLFITTACLKLTAQHGYCCVGCHMRELYQYYDYTQKRALGLLVTSLSRVHLQVTIRRCFVYVASATVHYVWLKNKYCCSDISSFYYALKSSVETNIN